MPFITISPDAHRSVASGEEHIPTLYYSDSWLIRTFFWMRLRLVWRVLMRTRKARGACLDFGGGGGALLPTLATGFSEVVCADRETKEAESIVRMHRLGNVHILNCDLLTTDFEGKTFDGIVAADVLEHFQNLKPPVDAILRALGPHGVLVTSLPTENWLYVALRAVFRITKPEDHYHTAAEVERYLTSRGFVPLRRLYVPLWIRAFPLFRITGWRHGGDA